LGQELMARAYHTGVLYYFLCEIVEELEILGCSKKNVAFHCFK